MLFRRKKQPDTDKRELTEALRSLEDLTNVLETQPQNRY
jgi:hypothetical protein